LLPVLAALPLVLFSGAAVLPEELIFEMADASSALSLAVEPEIFLVDTPPVDTLKYPFEDNYAPQAGQDTAPGLQMQNPSNVETNVEYDPETNTYIITETVGGQNVKPPTYMTFDEYQRYVAQKQEEEYWENRSAEETQASKNRLSLNWISTARCSTAFLAIVLLK
jgi:hypothetical protein